MTSGRFAPVPITMMALAFASVLGVSPRAQAFLSGDGKGRPERDCHVGLDGYSSDDLCPLDGKNPRQGIVCTDCDPACDLDRVETPNETCTFRIAACVNQPGVAGCEASPIAAVKATARAKRGRRLDLSDGLPLDGSSACGAFQDFVVPVGGRGTRQGIGTVKLGTKKPKDKDVFTFACVPRREGEPCPVTPDVPCAPPGPGDARAIKLSTGLGSESCRYGGLPGSPEPPLGGELRDCANEKIGDVGVGCLHFGGGRSLIPGGVTSDTAQHVYDVDRVCEDGTLMLRGGTGTGDRDCTLGVDGTVRYCANGTPGTDGSGGCQSDADCLPVCVDGTCQNGFPGTNGTGACSPGSSCGAGTQALVCIPRPKCFFGAPLPIENGAVSTCMQSVYGADPWGMADPAGGEISLTVPLSVRLYLTGTEFGAGRPCPACVSGTCEGGPRDGLSCTSAGFAGATHDCPPFAWQYLGPIDLTLSPFTTGTSMLPADGSVASDGLFCPGQAIPGALGDRRVCRILAFGEPASAGFSTTPAAVTLGATFCVGGTGSFVIDGAADLPGPGQFSLPGSVVLLPGDS